MTRIFYSDYGTDPVRLAKIEAIFKAFKKGGAEICRTSRYPIETIAKNLPLPSLVSLDPRDIGLSLLDDATARDPVIEYCSDLYRSDFPYFDASEEATYVSMHVYAEYIRPELEAFAPDLVILWHQFNAFHQMIADWCLKHDVPVMYAEAGALPGSWCFEYQGQMGESWICQDPERFKSLPLSSADLKAGRSYLEMARQGRLNRKGKGMSLKEVGQLEAITSNPRPKVLYAGNNDPKTGLQPLSERSFLHAAEFVSTDIGLEAMLRRAKEMDFHLLYKPHPSNKKMRPLQAPEEHYTLVDKRVDLLDVIDVSDVLATIVSQSAYMALFHGTPVVLMGRMQLTGSGMVHEALSRDRLSGAVRTAFEADPVDEEELVAHVARLMKYYVFAQEMKAKAPFPYGLRDMARSILASIK